MERESTHITTRPELLPINDFTYYSQLLKHCLVCHGKITITVSALEPSGALEKLNKITIDLSAQQSGNVADAIRRYGNVFRSDQSDNGYRSYFCKQMSQPD